MLGLCEQETPSFWISLTPFWNPSCPSWKSTFAPSDPAALTSSADHRSCPVLFSRKVNAFLDRMNPTEVQMASYLDLMREKLWPEPPSSAAAAAPHNDEEKTETRERAHSLISARCEARELLVSGFFIDHPFMWFVPRFQLHHPEEDRYGICF